MALTLKQIVVLGLSWAFLTACSGGVSEKEEEYTPQPIGAQQQVEPENIKSEFADFHGQLTEEHVKVEIVLFAKFSILTEI